MKKIVLFFSMLVSCMVSIRCYAQITVVPGATAAVLANKLGGPGVVIMNPTLTCAAIANGTFSGVSTLNFDSGIILTSGRAMTTAGNPGSNGPASAFASTGAGTPGDAQLTALAGQPTYDACVLEFDFRPAGDTVKFNYVFGSEEYTSYTCSPYNDVFGFFISGPGITGVVNLAKIPGTNIPVCINSVNCGPTGFYPLSTCTALGPGSPFCTYYINNSTGATITYDGLTKTLTALSRVSPCDTFHLKIGIADASDDILDSGVFLKAGSLTSKSFSSTSLGINPTDTGFGSQYCIRGCAPGMFIFHNTGDLNDSVIIYYGISGTGVNGVDYATILDSAVIQAHDSTDTVFIHGLTSASGTKTVKLLIYAPYSCGGAITIIDSVELTIYDSFYVHINTPDTAICIGQSVYINTSGSPTLNYLWTPSSTLNDDTLRSPTATPTVTTTYVVTVSLPLAGCPPSTTHIKITVVSPPTLDMGPPIQYACLHLPKQIAVIATPPAAYGYSWTPTTYLSNSTIANPIVTPGVVGDQQYVVTVISPVFGCDATDSFLLHVVPDDFSLLSPDSGMCYPAGPIQIRAEGDSQFTYHWFPTNGVSDPNIIDPIITTTEFTTTYIITAKYPGCPDIVHQVIYSIQNPKVNILIGDTTFCIKLPIPIEVEVLPLDSPYTFTWSPTDFLSDPSLLMPDFFSLDPGVFIYHLTITSGLGCTAVDSVIFRPVPPIKIDASPKHATIPYGSQVQLEAINLSSYELIYYWEPNDGSIDNPNINNPIGTPRDSTTYIIYAMNIYGCKDTAMAYINVDKAMNECIPSAFTPNGDGLNDLFRLCNMKYQRLVEFSVFNRWGQKVYHDVNGASKGWDGTYNGVPQDAGVYNYVVIIGSVDGTNKIYKGDVTLIR